MERRGLTINKKIFLYIMIIISILLLAPSIVYIITNRTVSGFDKYYTYTLTNDLTEEMHGIIVIGLVLLYSITYFLVIKYEKNIFNNRIKDILKFIIIISFIFMLILPFFSSDIYYYIGDSWLSSKYKENPYYTTVSDLQEQGINDEILSNTGYWKNTTSVYGPLYNSIAKLLVSLSFGNLTLALLIFKIASFLVHILNCYIIYKITQNTKYALIYGLNPLVTIELLSNVHNDIYLILFILLAIYFLVRLKNIPFTIIFLALSISIKYSSVLIVPFVLLYIFRKRSIPKRILYCILTGLSIIGIVVILYLPYFKDITVFTNMLVQNSRLSQSIMLVLKENLNQSIYTRINNIRLPIYVILYITSLICILFKKNISMKFIMKSYNFILLIFIFFVLTNFQKWYILWLLPTIIWQNKYMRKFILALTVTAIIPSWNYFIEGTDYWKEGIYYSVKMIGMSAAYIAIISIITILRRYMTKRKTLRT